MSDHPHHPHPGVPGAPESVPAAGTEAEIPVELTGHAAVDEVLRSMSDLQERPVEEHVAIFEAAHERLRTALSGVEDRPGDTAGR